MNDLPRLQICNIYIFIQTPRKEFRTITSPLYIFHSLWVFDRQYFTHIIKHRKNASRMIKRGRGKEMTIDWMPPDIVDNIRMILKRLYNLCRNLAPRSERSTLLSSLLLLYCFENRFKSSLISSSSHLSISHDITQWIRYISSSGVYAGLLFGFSPIRFLLRT